MLFFLNAKYRYIPYLNIIMPNLFRDTLFIQIPYIFATLIVCANVINPKQYQA